LNRVSQIAALANNVLENHEGTMDSRYPGVMCQKTTRLIETCISHMTAISCYRVLISSTNIAGHLPASVFVQAAAEPAAAHMHIGIAAVSDKRCWSDKVMTVYYGAVSVGLNT
jgi:hypothetical protein